jgi:hypothetical protein
VVDQTVPSPTIAYITSTWTGCFFTNLQPVSFWENILGFDLSQCVIPNANTYSNVPPLTKGVNITSAYVGANLFTSLNPNTLTPLPSGVPTDGYYYETTELNPISAVSAPNPVDAGYYLIDIQGLSSNYLNDNRSFSSILSISSRQNDQYGYITVYDDGSIQFVNTGLPFLLSHIRIRILDPITKQPASLLGSSNTVFLEHIPVEQQPLQLPERRRKGKS